jgi:CHAD domain-containing protein
VETREVEWQLDAVDLRPVARWLAEPAALAETGISKVDPCGSSNHVDTYLDTDDRRFHRAGYALRVRRVGRARTAGVEASLMEIDPAADERPGPSTRLEVREPFEQADPHLLATSDGPVGRRVQAVAGRKKIRRLFEVRTRRRMLSLEADGFPPGQIVLDETAIRPGAGGAPTRLQRVEIDAPAPALEVLQPFVDALSSACGLQPAGLTPYQAGVLTSGLRPVSRGFGPTAIDSQAPIGRAALAVLRRHFVVLLAKEPGTRLGDDPEELHDMRVAGRRLRAALSLFADVLPPSAASFGDDLRWLGRALGAVRDFDVQLEQLDGWLAQLPEPDREALAAVRALLETDRAAAREAMLSDLDSRRYEVFVGRFGRMLRVARGRRSGPASLPALVVAPSLIEDRFAALRAAAEQIAGDSPASDYHRLRIRCKRLRYALEFLADLYPGQTRRLTKRLVALQDVLGLHQDADVAIERLRALAATRGTELPPEAIFAMGELAERYRRRAVELRARVPQAYARVGGKAWKAFSKAIGAQRPLHAASAPPRARVNPGVGLS